MVAIGATAHLVTFEEPGPPIPDGHGGFTYAWPALAPASWYVQIQPANAATAERVAAGTILTHNAIVVRGANHPGLTSRCRMRDALGRVYAVISVVNVDLLGRQMEVIADLQT